MSLLLVILKVSSLTLFCVLKLFQFILWILLKFWKFVSMVDRKIWQSKFWSYWKFPLPFHKRKTISPWREVGKHLCLVVGQSSHCYLFWLKFFSILASTVHSRGKLLKVSVRTEILQFLNVCVLPMSIKLAFMKTKYNAQLLSGQWECCWNRGHLPHVAFLFLSKRSDLLEEYPGVIVYAKRKLN